MDAPGSKPQTAAQFVKQHSKHRKTIRMVLTELAMFIDAGNTCPSHKDIVEETGLSKSAVRHALGELEKDGTIVITKNGGSKVKGGKKDCYAIAGFTPVKPEAMLVKPVVESKPAAESVSPQSTVLESAVSQTVVPHTTVSHDTPEHKQHEISTGEYVYARGDAAGENEYLPEKQKIKDKNLLPPALQGGGEVVPKKVRAPRQPDPLFDAIAAHIFNIPPGDKAGIAALSGRIVKMLKLFPADKKTLTPERIAQFGRWWDATHRGRDGRPLSKPLSASTLAPHWSKFERENPVRPAMHAENAARLEANRRALEAENRRLSLEMLGALP